VRQWCRPYNKFMGAHLGTARPTPPGGQVVERSKPRPDVAFLGICSVKLLVEAVPTGSLMSAARCRVTFAVAARFRSRWLRFRFHGLVGGDQQISDAEVPARNVRQVRLFDSLVTAVQPE
jgi:hypothetical protein